MGIKEAPPTQGYNERQVLHAAIRAELLADLPVAESITRSPVETPPLMAYPDEWPFSRWSDTLSCFLALERLANEAGLTHTETRVADFHFSQGMVKAFAYPALEKIGMER